MLKTFKQFLESKKIPIPVANYYPSHGLHSQEKYPSGDHHHPSKNNKKIPIPVANYYPSHGSHSQENKKYSSADYHPSQKKMDESAKSPQTIDHEEFTSHNPNSKIHPTVSGVHSILNPSEEHWEKKLKPDERDAVKEYTSSSASTNRELIDTHNGQPSNFEHHPDDDSWTKDWKNGNKERHEKVVKGLDKLLNRSKVPRNLTVFHGINVPSSEKFNPGEEASKHPDRLVRIPSYLSTSVDPQISSSFARPEKWEGYEKKPATTHMLRIHLKRGQTGYKYVGNRSEIPSEREGILKRNSVLKIGEHPTIIHHPETGGQIHVWDAHLVDTHPTD